MVIALLARGMGLDVGLGTFLLLGPVLFLVTVVPISLNGIGLREAAFVALLKGVGVSTADAFVLGLAFFAVGVLTASLGGAVLLRRALAGSGRLRPSHVRHRERQRRRAAARLLNCELTTSRRPGSRATAVV